MPSESNFERIADQFNSLFALELHWNEHTPVDTVPVADLETFAKTVKMMLPALADFRISNALWTLTQNRFYAQAVGEDIRLMKRLDMSADERTRIVETISQPLMGGLVTMRDLKAYGAMFPKNLENHQMNAIMSAFYEAEHKVLQDAGLDRRSIAVTIGTLKRYDDVAREHVIHRRTVLTGRYWDSLDILNRFCDTIIRSLETMSSSTKQTTSLSKTIFKSKNKVVGLATIWGDTLPLMLCREWGIANMISITAGATVASILPSSLKAEVSIGGQILGRRFFVSKS